MFEMALWIAGWTRKSELVEDEIAGFDCFTYKS